MPVPVPNGNKRYIGPQSCGNLPAGNTPMKKKAKKAAKAKGKAKAAVMQPKFRSRTEPAKKGVKAYQRKPKHPDTGAE